MDARTGWKVLGAVAAVLAGLALVAGIATAIVTAADRDLWATVRTLAYAAAGAQFWRWIHLGARDRCRAIDDPEIETEPTGPWGVVGAVLMGVIVTALLGLTVWSGIAGRADRDRAEQARDEAVRAAKARSLTADEVRVWIARDDGSDLLDLRHGSIAVASTDGDHASILVRPDGGGPPCAVVDIVHDDLVRGRLTTDC